MNKHLAAVAALLLGGLAVHAQTCVNISRCTPPWKVTCNGVIDFHFERGKQVPLQAGPWYLYWPMEKEFVVPAPACCYPFWPARQVLPKLALGPPSPPPAPAPAVPPPPAYPPPTGPAAPAVPTVPPVPSTSAPAAPGTPAPSGLRPASYSAGAAPAAYAAPYSTMPVPDYWFER